MTCKKGDSGDTSGTDKEFSLASNNSAFSERSKDVFGGLLTLETNHVQREKRRKDHSDVDYMKNDPTDLETESLVKSNFKKPRLPGERQGEHSRERRQEDSRGPYRTASHQQDYRPYRARGPQRGFGRGHRRPRIPDYKMNPDKWTKYSLEDVSEEDMSEASTRRAALSFLEELRKRREEREGGGEEVVPADVERAACSRGHIVFKRPDNKNGGKKKSSSNENSVCTIPDEDEEMEGSAKDIADSDKKSVFKSVKTNKVQRHIRQRKAADDDDD